MSASRDALTFPITSAAQLVEYLPPPDCSNLKSPLGNDKPYTTLTYATSLDANLSLSPGAQTALSGPETKSMTHYLRSQHSAILIGVGTAIADNPSLNCRIEGTGGYGNEGLEGQPRPVILDPQGRWDVRENSKVIKLAKEGRGLGPWVLVSQEVCTDPNRERILKSVGGKYIGLIDPPNELSSWHFILAVLHLEGIKSLMIEGGGVVINDLLSPSNINLLDAVIVTVAPVWLGKDGVQVCPNKRKDEEGNKIAVGRLKNVRWLPLGEDVVLCGRPKVD